MKPLQTTANGSDSDSSAPPDGLGEGGALGSRTSRRTRTRTMPEGEALALRLWLPGHHTASLNRTAGKHWSKVRRMKKGDAAALYEALRDGPSFAKALEGALRAEALRVLAKLLLGVELEKKRGKKPPKPERAAYVRIERVTVSLLDEDNFKGGAKGLLDCLKAAFPTIILDDAPGYLVAEYVQTRCASKCEQGTWVEVAAEKPGAAGRPEWCTAEMGESQKGEF